MLAKLFCWPSMLVTSIRLLFEAVYPTWFSKYSIVIQEFGKTRAEADHLSVLFHYYDMNYIYLVNCDCAWNMLTYHECRSTWWVGAH